MKMLLLAIFVAFCTTLFALAFAQEDSAVAVYMAGQEPKGALGAHKMVGGELMKAISRSGKYSAINRTDEILKAITKEHGYQRSGAVSDDQIKTLGQQLGVQYLCIAEISNVKGGSFYLDVRLVDVVTAKTINSATATSALKNNSEMMAVAQQLARELVGGEAGAAAASGNTFTDSRDGKVYRKVVIGHQTWMAENLNYNAKGSKCYGKGSKVPTMWDKISDPTKTKTLSNNEIQENCEKYGRLYTWDAAKVDCPAGWYLPSDAEWTTLMDYIGGSSTAGKKLKSKGGWNSGGNGMDSYGFSALSGGSGNSDGDFSYADRGGYWWSSTETDAWNA